MRFAKRGIALVLTLVAVAGLVACGGDDEETTAGSTTTEAPAGNQPAGNGKESTRGDDEASTTMIVVRNGEPVGGIAELEYDAGEQVSFQVSSDVADEVHVHGYDLMKDVAAGGTVAFSFPADIEGIFEVELEERVEQIAELRVNP